MDTKRLNALLKEMITDDGAACFRSEDFMARRIAAINDLAKEALTITAGGEPAPQERPLTFEEAAKLGKWRELPSDFDQWGIANSHGWSVAHEAAEHGFLPDGFDRWAIANVNGWTVAHVAAENEALPDGFDQWDLKDDNGVTVAHIAAMHFYLPGDFEHWGLTNKHGRTVAHIAAECGWLPEDFELWDMRDAEGRTVAHVAAAHGTLPDNFKLWHLLDREGRTVAHDAAKYGRLPKGFKEWRLIDNDGRTVAHEAALSGLLPKDFDLWDLIDSRGWTVAHIAARDKRRATLPEGFSQWGMADNYGTTVAHVAARCGNLPADFNQWDLADDNGWSVAHEAAKYHQLPRNFNQWDLATIGGQTVRELAERLGCDPEKKGSTGPKMQALQTRKAPEGAFFFGATKGESLGIPGPNRVFRAGIVHDVDRVNREWFVLPVLALADQVIEVLPDVLARAPLGELEIIVAGIHQVRWSGADVERVLFLCGGFVRAHGYIPIRGREAFFSSFGSDSFHISLYFASEVNFPLT